MSAHSIIRSLLLVDLRSVHRDPMLRWLLGMPVVMALAMRFGIPPLTDWLEVRHGFDLRPYYSLIVSSVPLVMPAMVGAVTAFVLLDQKDDATLIALRVTPLPTTHYLAYRLTVPTVVATLTTIAAVPLVGLVEMNLTSIVIVAIGSAPIAALYALYVLAFARDKVQGFALMKAAGVFSIPPLISWWVAEPAQWLFGLAPYYWTAKLFWVLDAEPVRPGAAALSLTGAWLYIGGLAWLLLRRYRRVMMW